MRLYGDRPRPSDMDDAETAAGVSVQPRARRQLNEQLIDLHARRRIQRTQSDSLVYATVPAIDWNTGLTPLDAWLNQSAMPSVTQPQSMDDKRHDTNEESHTSRELKELEVFRKVHVKGPPTVAEQIGESDFLKGMPQCSMTRQFIYARKIRDRYPHLPGFLIHRLSRASAKRAEYLSKLRRYTWKEAKATKGKVPMARRRPKAARNKFWSLGVWAHGASLSSPSSSSHCSARNSSLYGTGVDCKSDQELSISQDSSSSASFGDSRPGFILPPVHITNAVECICDICYQRVGDMDGPSWQ